MRSETVVRLRGRYTDPITGDPIGTDWTAPDELEISTLAPAEPWPSAGAQAEAARTDSLIGWKLYLPAGADVTSRDRVVVRGTTYTVAEQPADWAGAGVVVVVADIQTATCSIRHPGGTKGPFDRDTGTYPVVPFDPHYTGGCQIRVLSPAEQREMFGEEQVTSLVYLVVVDLDASTAVRPDDVVDITGIDANTDPMLAGQQLKVRSFARGPLPWQRDLHCTFLFPKS